MQTILWKLMFMLLVSFSIVIFSGTVISETFAQTKLPAKTCVPMSQKNEVLQRLETEYKEKQVLTGVSDRGHLVNIYINLDTGTWTVIGITPTNFLCVLDTGSGVVVTPENLVSGTST